MRIQLSAAEVRFRDATTLFFTVPFFQAGPGERILIKGASGTGKTTLLHLIAGLFLPVGGTVDIGGHCLSAMSDHQRCLFRRRYTGIVFQKLNLIDHCTALENVLLSMRTGKEAKTIAGDALDRVGLAQYHRARAAQLSLGEQQRVAVARILATQPRVVLADEPTSSLDDANAARVMELLSALSHDTTVIAVSHDHRIENCFSTVIRLEELITR